MELSKKVLCNEDSIVDHIHYDSLKNEVKLLVTDIEAEDGYIYKTVNINKDGIITSVTHKNPNENNHITTNSIDKDKLGFDFIQLTAFLTKNANFIELNEESISSEINNSEYYQSNDNKVSYKYSNLENELSIVIMHSDNGGEQFVIKPNGTSTYAYGDYISNISNEEYSRDETIEQLNKRGFNTEIIKDDIKNIDDSVLRILKDLTNETKKTITQKLKN